MLYTADTMGFIAYCISSQRLLELHTGCIEPFQRTYYSFVQLLDVSGRHVKYSQIKFPLVTSSQSQSHITTDDQSVSASWFRAPFGAHDQMLITV
jgi:hypothetical protein